MINLMKADGYQVFQGRRRLWGLLGLILLPSFLLLGLFLLLVSLLGGGLDWLQGYQILRQHLADPLGYGDFMEMVAPVPAFSLLIFTMKALNSVWHEEIKDQTILNILSFGYRPWELVVSKELLTLGLIGCQVLLSQVLATGVGYGLFGLNLWSDFFSYYRLWFPTLLMFIACYLWLRTLDLTGTGDLLVTFGLLIAPNLWVNLLPRLTVMKLLSPYLPGSLLLPGSLQALGEGWAFLTGLAYFFLFTFLAVDTLNRRDYY